MGCGASNAVNSSSFYAIEVNHMWVKAMDTVKNIKVNMADLVVKRNSWKTVRIFVSSTFKDFHAEREILVKKVFPDLRAWCELRKLYLVECDLRWGVPKDFTMEATLRACLGEIDRCYQDNKMPFFLNMTSERVGWVPQGEEIPDGIKSEYDWIEGLSVTEMEIMHGAYRIDNPNSLFMLRDPSFLKDCPDEVQKVFSEESELMLLKLQALKKKLQEKFPSKRVIKYKVEFEGYNPETKTINLGALDKEFSKTVFEFFQKRISEQYPLEKGNLDPFIQRKQQNEAFMRSRCDTVVGRDDMLKTMDSYVCGVGNDVPFLLVGDAGSGKSSVMAKICDVTVNKAVSGKIPGAGGTSWHAFYHFVGAVPGSTELLPMLQRLLKELKVVDDSTLPSDLDTACQMTCGALANVNTRPVVIVVDALNQYDEETPAELVSWVPKKLAPHVRCIFSMISETKQHKALISREPQPTQLLILPLQEQDRKCIVEQQLGRYNKRLDENQMKTLLSKLSSENPLWLSIACEELRVFGLFRQISDKINQLPDGLLELEQMVLSRFEEEGGGELLIATVCLLEVSARGLLESELLTILGDEDNLMPKKIVDEESSENKEKEDRGKEKQPGQLPAYKWADIYRALRPFLRPFGDSGEGRLDFYHRSLSKAVRKKYFSGSDSETKYAWWHRKLADFFQHRCKNLSRKLEELPPHLIALKDEPAIETFLTTWEVFDELFNEDYSLKLLEYWRKGSSLDNMEAAYNVSLNNFSNKQGVKREDVCIRYIQITRLFAQGGRYTKASELSASALTMEKEELGERPKQIADLNYLKAQVMDEIMKLGEYMYRSQLPKIFEIITSYNDALVIFNTMEGELIKRKRGKIYCRLSFYYLSYVMRGGDHLMTVEVAQGKSEETVDKAIEIFTELEDDSLLADALITKGVSYGKPCTQQIEHYKEAEELALRVGGELHFCLDRLYLNMAIYYEEIGDHHSAYDYFHKWYELCCNLYGLTHPKTVRPIKTLQEPMYRRIAQEKGISVPETA